MPGPHAYLKPNSLDIDPADPDADKKFAHWVKTFNNYAKDLDPNASKLDLLVNHVGHQAFAIIENSEDYESAITSLKTAYQKVNTIYAQHILSTRKQAADESVDDFIRNLRLLAKNCSFKAVTAAENQDLHVRNAFISGLRTPYIRQRLLENKNLTLETAVSTARSLEDAQKNSDTYGSHPQTCSAVEPAPFSNRSKPSEGPENLVAASRPYYRQQSSSNNRTSNPMHSNALKCYFCGYDMHPRKRCPARDSTCDKCQRRGHFAKVCRANYAPASASKVMAASYNTSVPKEPSYNTSVSHEPYSGDRATQESSLPTSWPPNAVLWAICSSSPDPCLNHPLAQSMQNVMINNQKVMATADSASSSSFIHPTCAKNLNLTLIPIYQDYEVGMASKSLKATASHCCDVQLNLKGRDYKNVRLFVLPNLCTNVILGLDFLSRHKSITLNYGGVEPPLSICGLSTVKTKPKSLFPNLPPECKPVADGRRRYSREDQQFISVEIDRLLKEQIIEPSRSPWRAQVVIVKKDDKKRMTVDYSQTINLYTQLDAYPLPLISDLLNQIAQNNIFSTVDLRSAYHQLLLKPEERIYTAFEANGRLYQFRRLPFGVTNGVSIFQREMDELVDKYSLKGVYPYIDNITIVGKTQEEHDLNLSNFLSAAEEVNLTYNPDKCEFNTRKLRLLGCLIENGELRPDPDRMRPLEMLPPPNNLKSLKRCLGFFSHYSKWIPNFSHKVKPLARTNSFPLSAEALKAIEDMKKDIKNSVICCIDETIPFTVECDASDIALAATLNQKGRPVAFFSRTLSSHELLYPSVEKEAMAIVESVRFWRHFLAPRRFTLVTDQRSISFMFNTNLKSRKIKNQKFQRWRIELSTYNYDIHYRPGKFNECADALSRICSASSGVSLKVIHEQLCHPGVTRLLHFIKTRNLPFSVEEVKSTVRSCPACMEVRPKFFQPPEKSHLIKATKPMERLNLDFKGPLPTNNKNAYFLNIIDEYSRFVWIYPCSNIDARTVSSCLLQLFTLCGFPNYIHSDRGAAFMSSELRSFLSSKGVATSRTTPYNPRGNGQVEKENSTIWKSILLTLKTKNLPITNWQDVLPEVLHATRSLLCTATNETPHDLFFKFPRKAAVGSSLPTWLLNPGPVYLKRHVRNRKSDPLVEPVTLVHTNPEFAFIRHQDGREDTVSLRDLAPAPCNVENPVPQAQEPMLLEGQTITPLDTLHSPINTTPSSSASDNTTPSSPASDNTTPSSSASGNKKTLMGPSGGGWCNVDPQNMLDTKRRASNN